MGREARTSSRFGNQVFMYLAQHVVAHLAGYDIITEGEEGLGEGGAPVATMGEASYDQMGQVRARAPGADVRMTGYYQDLDLANRAYPLTASLFSRVNPDVLYNGIRVCDLMSYELPLEKTPGPRDLVLHVRLDDFAHNGHDSEVLPVAYYLEQARDSAGVHGPWETIWVVCDQAKKEWERAYLDRLVEGLSAAATHVRLQQGTLLEDWTILRRATHLVCSNSTFAWTAAILGTPQSTVIPDTGYHQSSQRLVPLAHIPDCRVHPYRLRP